MAQWLMHCSVTTVAKSFTPASIKAKVHSQARVKKKLQRKKKKKEENEKASEEGVCGSLVNALFCNYSGQSFDSWM